MNEAQQRFKYAYERALHTLRSGQAVEAERQLHVIQAALPGEVNSLRLLGLALLAQQKDTEAVALLQQTVEKAPDFPLARADLARALRQARRTPESYTEIRAVLEQAPALAIGWLILADVLVDLGKYPDAAAAYGRYRQLDPVAPRLKRARQALQAGHRAEAESGFREILKTDASQIGALCGLASILIDSGMAKEAERLLRHALTQTAHAPQVWGLLGQTLLDDGRLAEAEAAFRRALLVEPQNAQYWIAVGTVSARLLKPEAALAAYEAAERFDPTLPLVHLSIGHVLKTLGRRAECERVYHECINLEADCGEAYWSLADLKNYVFSAAEISDMQRQLASPGNDANAALLHFALGRALELQQADPQAFAHYAAGNSLRRRISPFDFDRYESKCRRVIAALGADYFAAIGDCGCADGAPIFIVGLPRSGSTLVEQILASHPSVEATMELPNIPGYVRELDQLNAQWDAYPECLRRAPPAVLAALGRRYLEETQPLRTSRPRFIDKLPNNFTHVGLIHAMLPNATVIDVRRHPMDSCFSCYKQYFSSGQAFTYDLKGLGRYYRGYLDLMDHWDAMLPGKVLHLSYEELVRAPEGQIRRLLAHCGLPFDARCLQFHATQRPIRTASSEQVRLPLYRTAVGHWRRFERELQPLRLSLGDCLERFDP